MSSGKDHEFPAGEARAFHTTHWSLVAAARDGGESGMQRKALEQLCRTYWQPLYWFVRRKGHSDEDARDLTQGFFEQFIGKSYIDGVDADRGRFRTWLLTAMSRYLINEWDRSRRRKRGGDVQFVPLDGPLAESEIGIAPGDHRTPERIYEQQWVQALLAKVLQRLRSEAVEAGREPHFDVLKVHLTGGRGEEPMAGAAEALGLSVAAVKSAIHRLRQRYGKLFREEVAHTLSDPAELEDEIRYLLSVMTPRD
jgi:RNA polymerase sigma factor (sigma-70 family)